MIGDMDDTWASRDLPVLEAIVTTLDSDPNTIPTLHDIAERLGKPVTEVGKAALALDGSYFELHKLMTGGDFGPWFVTKVYPSARIAVGQWPSGEVWTNRLVKALSEAAESEPDERKKSKLRATAEAVAGVARDITVEVLSGGIVKAAGL